MLAKSESTSVDLQEAAQQARDISTKLRETGHLAHANKMQGLAVQLDAAATQAVVSAAEEAEQAIQKKRLDDAYERKRQREGKPKAATRSVECLSEHYLRVLHYAMQGAMRCLRVCKYVSSTVRVSDRVSSSGALG